jgi:hypothetical protein
MAGRSRSRDSAARCGYLRADGLACTSTLPKGWDFCVAHAERRGADILAETPERVELVVSIPRFNVPLAGITRSQWEAIRLEMCGIVLPPEQPDL